MFISFRFAITRHSLWTQEINPLNAELNPIRNLLALLGVRHIFHVSGLRVNGCCVCGYFLFCCFSQVKSMGSIFKYDEAAHFQVHSTLHQLYPSSSRLHCPVNHAVNQRR